MRPCKCVAWQYIYLNLIITVYLASQRAILAFQKAIFSIEEERMRANSECPFLVIECVSLCRNCTPLSQQAKILLQC